MDQAHVQSPDFVSLAFFTSLNPAHACSPCCRPRLERVSVSVLGTQLNENLLESEILETYEFDTESVVTYGAPTVMSVGALL